MRKTIGNILLIIAGISAVIMIFLISSEDHEVYDALFPIYFISIFGGIILRIGDFFKWAAKKFGQGIIESQKNNSTHFCPHCGSGLNDTTAFCPNCGKKLN